MSHLEVLAYLKSVDLKDFLKNIDIKDFLPGIRRFSVKFFIAFSLKG